MDIESGRSQGNTHRRAASVARSFVREASFQSHQYLMARIQHMIIGLVVLFFVVSMLPPSYVLWLLVLILLMLFSRFALIRTSLDRRSNSLDVLRTSVFNHPLYLLASGSNVNVMNLRLMLLDRDFDGQDYDMLLALDRQLSGTVANPVSDEEISRLPLHRFKIVEGDQEEGGQKCEKEEGEGEGEPGCCKETYEMCSVCLEPFKDKDQVMSLPCMHFYHPNCITPWMKRQGKQATCPVCKQFIFEYSSPVISEPEV
eukprot:TRINITY_DN6196_c0_g2_i1.p1 TRINITY_DN6196_c0_g2~~TRINITY_DN6196_c0_g2_i1.p1  ORF type:complete len:286 (+),score=28.53 TRINITY_DN6196_c0_g2_i1:89-859(+)